MPSNNGIYYDPVRKEVHGKKAAEINFDKRGLSWILFEKMKKWSKEGLIAQINADTGEKDSFSELLSRCIRTALALKELGIGHGDIIAICSYNHFDSIVPFVASCFVGAITAPTDPTLCIDDMAHLLNLVKPKLIFTSSGSEHHIEKALRGLEFDCEIVSFAKSCDKFRCFSWFLEARADENAFEPWTSQDLFETCLILFSSGTTGLPKGMCLNHYFIMNCVEGTNSVISTRSTFLGFASLYWISAVMINVSCIHQGHRRLLCESFDPEIFCDYIETYQVDFVFLAPVQVIKTLPYLNEKAKRLKNMVIGGGCLAPVYMRQLRDLLPDTFVVSGYGQTEIGYISSLFKKDENYNKLETCGLPVAGRIIKICDPETEEALALKEVGEIRVKIKHPMNGYYKRDSSDVWDADGFLKTGDLGYFDDDLCLFVTDRIKEMFKYMSWHIVPAKLEVILQEHPAVQLAVVIGIPHPTEDNHALGIVTLEPGMNTTTQELEAFVEGRVDERHLLRAGVIILRLDQLPMTPTGKVKRRELKDLVIKQIRTRA